MKLNTLFFFFASASVASAKDYSGYSILRVGDIASSADAALVRQLVIHEAGQLKPFEDRPVSPGRESYLAVSPERRTAVSAALEAAGMSVEVAIENLSGLIMAERGRAEEDCTVEGSQYDGEFTFDQYYDVEVFHDYFDYLESTYDFVSTVSIGQSYEGRDMRVLRICKGECGDRYGMWVDAGIHAREWIAPAAAMYLAQELVENESEHPDLTEDLDWFILPSTNPDGYAYSRDQEDGDRFWRMTRSPNEGSECVGTDGNRNWGYEWGPEGSSDDPCDPNQTYHGDGPFSEVEIVNVAGFINASRDDDRPGRLVYYMAMHSYMEAVLLPWSYSEEEIFYLDQLFDMAIPAAEAMSSLYGVEYVVDTIPNLVGESAGGSIDWTIAVGGVKYSYGMELRGGPFPVGQYGFLLPPEEICPCSKEVFAFHETIARAIVQEFGIPE